MPILTTLGLLFVAGLCGAVLTGCDSDNGNKDDEVKQKDMVDGAVKGATSGVAEQSVKGVTGQDAGGGIANQGADSIPGQSEAEDTPAVSGALVVCTCMQEKTSESKMIVKEPGSSTILQGGAQLGYKDIQFKEVFKGCSSRGGGSGSCMPEIEGEQWQSVNAKQMNSNEDKTVYIAHSYMFCTAGGGLIWLDDDGQHSQTVEDQGRSMEFHRNFESKILEYYVNEKTLTALGWDMQLFKESYGNNALNRLRQVMFEMRIMNPESIKMFIATMDHESKHGALAIEIAKSGDGYTETTRGAGLIQVTAESQKAFFEYLYRTLPEGNEKKEIGNYINGYRKNASGNLENTYTIMLTDDEVEKIKALAKYKRDNVYQDVDVDGIDNLLNASEYIERNYALESAAWYWGKMMKVNVQGQGMTINQFVENQTKKPIYNSYNTFYSTQAFVNGKEFSDDALDRISGFPNDVKIVNKTDPGKKCAKDNPEGGCGDRPYCLTVPDEVDRHSYAPINWDDREESWEKIININ